MILKDKLRIPLERFGLSKKKRIVGLDIGKGSIKLVELHFGEKRPILIKAIVEDVKFSEDRMQQRQATIQALEALKKKIDFKGAKVVSLIGGPNVLVKEILIPPVPKNELPEAIKWKVKELIRFPVEEAIIDYEITGEEKEKEAKKLKVMVAVSSQDEIRWYLDLFNEVGIKPSLFLLLSLSFCNLLRLKKISEDEALLILDIGDDKTEIDIFRSYSLKLRREILLGGRSITSAMTGTLISDYGQIELDYTEAEKIKREWGIPAEDKQEMIREGVFTSQILAMIKPVLERFLAEIQRSLRFYQQESRQEKIERMVLFGGAARLKGLKEYLAQRLGMAVEMGDSLVDLDISPTLERKEIEAEGLRFAGAVGAALSEAKGVNLLPQEVKEEAKRFVQKVSFEAVVTTAIVVLFLFYSGIRLQLVGYEKKNSGVQVQLNTLQPQLEEAASFEGLQAKVARREAIIERIFSNEPYWKEALKEISNLIPANIFLIRLEAKERLFNFKGVVSTPEQIAESILAGFMQSLEEGMFKEPRLVSFKKSQELSAASEFEFTCQLD